MKLLVVLFAVLALTAAEKYSSQNDDFDIKGLVANPELFKVFLDCFNDLTECPPKAALAKKDLKEAIEQSCEKCTESQIYQLKTFVNAAKEQNNAGYEIFRKKYDPESKYLPTL